MGCEVLFFPNKDNEQKVVDFINLAKKELKICVFTFTNQNLAMAILNKVMIEKVKVRIITDDEQNLNKYSIVDVLQSASNDLIKFRTDLRKDAHMHHKYVVIDDKYIATGSFNWTAAAVEKNNENLLLFKEINLAKQYSKNFEELWEQFKSTEVTLKKVEQDKKKEVILQWKKAEQLISVKQNTQNKEIKTNDIDEASKQKIVSNKEEEEQKVKRSKKVEQNQIQGECTEESLIGMKFLNSNDSGQQNKGEKVKWKRKFKNKRKLLRRLKRKAEQ